jgi:hypothetical protein
MRGAASRIAPAPIMIVCAECLRCRHRGALDAAKLTRHALSPDVSMAELSRVVVCDVCGSHAVRLERRMPEEAQAFVEG